VLCSALIVVGLVAAPAGAAKKPATSKQLIQKLVAAGVCTNPLPKDAQGVMYQCHSNTYNTDVWIRAFPTAKAMKRDLDSNINPSCTGTVSVVMGPNWWMNPYNGNLRASITAKIGGKLRTFAC
jgi:hypothetical protein